MFGKPKYVVIVTATDFEYQAMVYAFDKKPKQKFVAGLKISTGKIGGILVRLVQSEVSMVNASRAMEYIIVKYCKPLAVFVYGIANSIHRSCDMYSVVVPKKWINCGEQLWVKSGSNMAKATADKLVLPGFCSDTCPVPNRYLLPLQMKDDTGNTTQMYVYDVDVGLYKIAMRCSYSYNINFRGKGGSGSILLADPEFAEYLNRVWDDDLLVFDMETVAVAHVCHIYEIPFLSYRLVVGSVYTGLPTDYTSYDKFPYSVLTSTCRSLFCDPEFAKYMGFKSIKQKKPTSSKYRKKLSYHV